MVLLRQRSLSACFHGQLDAAVQDRAGVLLNESLPLHYCTWSLQGEGPHTAAAFSKLQERTRQLQERGAAATARLEQQRQQVADVAAAAKVSLHLTSVVGVCTGCSGMPSCVCASAYVAHAADLRSRHCRLLAPPLLSRE